MGIFENSTTVKAKDGSIVTKKIHELFVKISKAKYPAITEAEEEISIPLQVLCLAIFDCILLHMMLSVSGTEWIFIKDEICEKLNKDKIKRTCEIIEKSYGDSSIIALQECGAVFSQHINNYGEMSEKYSLFLPANMDRSRDQNSVILLSKSVFDCSSVSEITEEVMAELKKKDAKVPVVAGDLFVISVNANESIESPKKFILASFHGDTNGLATIPVVEALTNVYNANYAQTHCLVFCLDANAYEKPTSGQQGVVEFVKDFCARGLSSCFGDEPVPSNYTTYNARTFLQPQLNKACKSSEKHKGDVNPKDFILFSKNHFVVENRQKI